MNSEKFEQLAALEHDQWAHWMQYMFSLCAEDEEGNYVIPLASVAQWQRQAATGYEELSEKEKNSDREWAEKVWRIITDEATD